jgi:hypothetical protein
MKYYLSLFWICSLLLSACNSNNNLSWFGSAKTAEKPIVDSVKLHSKAQEALKFCEKNKYNQDFCILIDMSLHSGVNRFFIWNFKTQQIEKEMLVSHGCCDNAWTDDDSRENPTFSNVDGSHCSSLGKYLIGERGVSQFGVNIKYLLHGLEESNKNALKRAIVFHSWELVPNEELFPKGTPEGWGCPAISDANFLELDKKLKGTEKVLMWMYV